MNRIVTRSSELNWVEVGPPEQSVLKIATQQHKSGGESKISKKEQKGESPPIRGQRKDPSSPDVGHKWG